MPARTSGKRPLARLRNAGVNALVLDPSRLQPATLVLGRSRAAAAHLQRIEILPHAGTNNPTAHAVRRACRARHNSSLLRCARLSRAPEVALRSSRHASSHELVAVRLGGPSEMWRLRSAAGPGHVIALTKLDSRRTFPRNAWEYAVKVAAKNTALDLGVSPQGGSATVVTDQYSAVVGEQTKQSRRDKTPPSVSITKPSTGTTTKGTTAVDA